MAGKHPDSRIAEHVGVSIGTVRSWRIKAGIPNYYAHIRTQIREKLSERADELGKRPDYRIAEDLGVTPLAVRSFRRSMGIPVYSAHKRTRGKS